MNNLLSGLKLVHNQMWERRVNLHGAKLINSVLPYKPFVYYDDANFTNMRGFSVEIFKLLSADLNFTMHHISPKDESWGMMDPVTQQFSGILGELQRNVN